jgi:hypothetical protein
MFNLKGLTSFRNWRDFGRLFRNHKCEIDDEGDLLIGGARMGGEYFVRNSVTGLWIPGKNTGTYEGYNYLLRCVFGNNSPPTSMFIAPYTANQTPTSSWTAAIFHSTAIEETTGYSETTRQAYVESTPSSGSVDNYSNPAVFTATGAVTWYGFGVLNTATKDDASVYPTQALMGAAKFATAETLSGSGSQLAIKYRYYIQPVS